MTQLGAITYIDGAERLYLYGLANPSVGANTIVVTHDTDIVGTVKAIASSYTGVGSVGTPATAYSGGSGVPTVTVSSATNDLVVDFAMLVWGGSTLTPTAGQTARNQTTWDGDYWLQMGSSDKPGAASVAMSWNYAHFSWGTIAVWLRP
jgi:hypothetical protein